MEYLENQELLALFQRARPSIDNYKVMANEYARLEEREQQLYALRRQGMGGGKIVLGIFLCLLYVVPGVLFFIFTNKAKNSRIQNELNFIYGQKERLEIEGRRIIDTIANTGIFKYVPYEYIVDTIFDAAARIEGYLRFGRAESMKEAINLFEEEKHRITMQSLQMQSIEQAKTNEMLLRYNNAMTTAAVATNIMNYLK